jgi:hypothetical protein
MALVARGDLTVWISPDLDWHAGKGTRRRGRPQVFTDAAIQTALTLKVLYQLPLRAAQGMVGGLIRLAGLDWRVPHYSTHSRRQKDLVVTIPYRPRRGPLHLVIDSTGLKEMIDHRHGDGAIAPGLLAQVPEGERIGVISGDGAYDTRGVYAPSIFRQAAMIVPPRRNGRPWMARTAGAGE